jgi:hypothetical protein
MGGLIYESLSSPLLKIPQGAFGLHQSLTYLRLGSCALDSLGLSKTNAKICECPFRPDPERVETEISRRFAE